MLTMPTLRERGWTPAMVRDLLGDPDALCKNPVYRTAAPMRLWSLDRVARMEGDPEFERRRALAQRRSAASSRAAARRRDELLAEVAQVPVGVPKLTRDRLTRQACAHYNNFRSGRWDYDDDEFTPATLDSDPAFLERITVNYLRHELTNYEEQLWALFGRVGRNEAEELVRERVYRAIAEAYPELAAECDRQLARRRALAAAIATERSSLRRS